MVYLTFEREQKVTLLNPRQLPTRDLNARYTIMLGLLGDIARRKACDEHGYFLAVNTPEYIGEGEVHNPTGDVILSVTFTCLAMKPVKGDIFIGTVDKVLKDGVFLKYGPIEDIFLSEKEMKGYRYDGEVEEEPEFVNESRRLKIGLGSKVRFTVVGSYWIESDKEFQVLASLGDDGAHGVFGPI